MNKDRIKKITRLLFTAILTILCAAALFHSIKKVTDFPEWLVDDAFINFRYAENFAVHGELNWNPGMDPTEGYTGVAMVWLLSAAMKMGISPVTAAHFLGIFFYYFGAVILILIFRGINLAGAAVLVLYLTAPFFYSHAWSGLETTMFTSLVIFAIYNYHARHQRLFAASLLLLSFSRPEGILLSVILLVLFRPFSWSLALLYAVPFSIYYLWRWGYYGRLVPNTFYAKLFAESEENTLGSMRRFFTLYLQIPLLLAFIPMTLDKIRGNLRLIAGLAVFMAACIAVYLSSHLVMNYAYRFFVPFYPIFILALGGVLHRSRIDAKLLILAVVLITPQVMKHMDKRLLRDAADYSRTHYKMLEDEHIQIGKYLRENVDPDEWLVVHADAGAIPYHSKLKTIDCGRLNDEYLARGEASPQQVADYIYSHDPGAMVFTSSNSRMVQHGPEADMILRDERFTDYRLVQRYSSSHRRNYFEFLYLRSDIADSLGLTTFDVVQNPAYIKTQPIQQEMGNTGLAEGQSKQIRSAPDWMVSPEKGLKEDLDNADGLWNYAKKEENRKIRRSAFEKFLREYEDDSRIPEALWELSAVIEAPAERLEKLRLLYEKYPASENAPKALFAIGFIYSEELKDAEKARECFMELINKYPESDMIETVKWMLENSGGSSPDFE